MHLAFVKQSCHLNSPPYFGDLTLLFKKLSTTGIKYDVRAWNDPNIDWTEYSHIIMTSEIDYDSHIEEFFEWIQKLEKLQQNNAFKLWNSSRIVQWNYNKKYLLELEEKNIRIPATVFLGQNTDKNDMADAVLSGFKKYGRRITEIVVKNAVGAAGTSVWRSKLVETSDGTFTIQTSAVERLYQQLKSPEGRFGILIQEFLPVIFEEGEWSLVYFNKQFSHAVIKRPKSDKSDISDKSPDGAEFRVQSRYGGHAEVLPNGKVPESLIRFGEEALETLPENILHARVDILMGEDKKPYLLELEVLDMLLFISEPVFAERYLQAIMTL